MFKNEYYVWTSVLLLDSIVNVNEEHYPLVFSNKCKYITSKQKIKVTKGLDEELIIDYSNDKEYDTFNED